MPVKTSYPGVYIEELPSNVRTIVGVGTSVTAFVGYTSRGRDHRATRIFGFADFERAFGGLATDSLVSYAVSHFYANGGGEAVVVRVPKHDAVAAAITLRDGTMGASKSALTLTASSKGAWANDLLVDVDYAVPAGDPKAFNLVLTDVGTGATERFANVTLDTARANNVIAVVNDPATGSAFVTATIPDATAGRPQATGTIGGPVADALAPRHEVVRAARSGGDVRVDITSQGSIEEMLRGVGRFDALVSCAGSGAWKPLEELSDEDFETSLHNKLMGQVNLVRRGLATVAEGGSFTLTSGVLAHDPIRLGACASLVNGAIDCFVRAAAIELPRGLRINSISPGVLEESLPSYGPYFLGHEAVPGKRVANAYVKSVEGLLTGQVIHVL